MSHASTWDLPIPTDCPDFNPQDAHGEQHLTNGPKSPYFTTFVQVANKHFDQHSCEYPHRSCTVEESNEQKLESYKKRIAILMTIFPDNLSARDCYHLRKTRKFFLPYTWHKSILSTFESSKFIFKPIPEFGN